MRSLDLASTNDEGQADGNATEGTNLLKQNQRPPIPLKKRKTVDNDVRCQSKTKARASHCHLRAQT